MIRLIVSIIFIIFVIFYTLIDIIICCVSSLFGKTNLREYYHKVVYVFTNVLLFISGAKVNVLYKDNINKIQKLVKNGEPVFIVSNHRSNYDLIIGYSLLNIPCGIVAKNNLLKVPFISYWMKKIDCIFLDRTDIRSGIQMVLEAINKINVGTPIWVCPEGTRNKNADSLSILEFKLGTFKIASKTNAYVCPIAFYKTDEIFEKHKPFIKSANVGISIGNLFKYDALDEKNKENISTYTENIVRNMLIELKEVVDGKRNCKNNKC